jgi:hypothetical protein
MNTPKLKRLFVMPLSRIDNQELAELRDARGWVGNRVVYPERRARS